MAYQPNSSFQYNVDVVGSCNLRCPSCPVGNIGPNAMPKGLMLVETFAKVLEKIERDRPSETITVALYDWGEPTLHPDLAKMITMVRDAGFKAQVSSNLNVDNNLRDIVKAAADLFAISTSGLFDETYSRTHTGGSALMLKSNLYRLAWLRDRYGTETDFVIYYHLYKHNQGRDLQSVRAIAEELGFRLETFAAFLYPMEKNLMAIDGTLPEHDRELVDLLVVSPQKRIELLRKVASNNSSHPMVSDCTHRTHKMSIRFDTSVPLCCTIYDATADVSRSFLESSHEDIQASRYDRSICAACMENALHLSVRLTEDSPA
ncbi:MAG: radical SAM protein [Thalassobaculaceae bacterium]